MTMHTYKGLVGFGAGGMTGLSMPHFEDPISPQFVTLGFVSLDWLTRRRVRRFAKVLTPSFKSVE